jgi:hypothetical protein
METKQSDVELNMIIETDLPASDLMDKFIEWVESNGWVCNGTGKPVDEWGNEKDKIVLKLKQIFILYR